MRSTALGLALWLALTGTGHATSVVALRLGEQFFIATDSRVINADAQLRRPTCKIHQGQGCIFATMGPWRPAFDAPGIGARACAQGRDADAKLAAFFSLGQQPLLEAYRLALRERPAFAHRVQAVEIVLIGRRAGRLVMLQTGMRVSDSGADVVVSPAREIVSGGLLRNDQALSEMQRRHPGGLEFLAPGVLLRGLVEAMMPTHPEVGPPVAVLAIDPTPRWAERGLCPALDPTLLP